MRVLIVSNYYAPEAVGAAVWVPQLALGLKRMGHSVTVLTSFPSYPSGEVFGRYQGVRFLREDIDGVAVVRTLTLAARSRSFWWKVSSWGCFCVSSLIQGGAARLGADVVYVVMPPMPLGVSGWVLARLASASVVTNVQDIYPDIAVELGLLRNRFAIEFFRWLERWIYRRSDRVVVISPSFRDNLRRKGVPEEKLVVVSNWADPDEITPLPRQNRFRTEVGVPASDLLLVYSGSLSLNSMLEPLLEALSGLRATAVRLLVIGEGTRKREIEARAVELGVRAEFLPFQPLERYGEVLSAADLAVVTANAAGSTCSVPSKIFKHMSAGTASLVITSGRGELTRLIEESGGGISCDDGDPATIASLLRWALENRAEVEAMGRRAREYLVRHCSLDVCVARIASTLEDAVRCRG